MKNFREAVKRKMEKEGWTVERITNSPINLRCERDSRVRLVCAWQNGHGHLYMDILSGLKQVQKATGYHVLVAKVNGANEIIFIRLDKFTNPQKRKTKTHNFTVTEPRELGFIAHLNGEFKRGGENEYKTKRKDR